MTQIQPLSFEVLSDHITYGGGVAGLYRGTPFPSLPGYVVVPTLPIDLNPNGDGRPIGSIGCSSEHPCDDCFTTPCVVVHKRPKPKSGWPLLALANSLTFGVYEMHAPSGTGPLFMIRGASTLDEVKPRVRSWLADQPGHTNIHVYKLDLTNVSGLAANLATFVALPVASVTTDAVSKSVEAFFDAS